MWGSFFLLSSESFASLANWIKDARDLARSDICVTVVGNKKDLSNERIITFVEGAKFCQENNVSFMETSCVTGENVNEAFDMLTKTIIDKIENGECFCANSVNFRLRSFGNQRDQAKNNDNNKKRKKLQCQPEKVQRVLAKLGLLGL